MLLSAISNESFKTHTRRRCRTVGMKIRNDGFLDTENGEKQLTADVNVTNDDYEITVDRRSSFHVTYSKKLAGYQRKQRN